MRKTVTFAVIPDGLAEVASASDEIDAERTGTVDGAVIGTYEYESDPAFGSPTTASGQYVYDPETALAGIVTEADRPKPDTVFRKLREASGLPVEAPEYPATASHDWYETYGFNGYTTEFREGLREYTLDTSYRSVDPEERAKERAMHDSYTQMSDDLVDEIVAELIDDGYYVAFMDMLLEEDGANARFSNPLSIGGIAEDEWSERTLRLVLKRAIELYTDSVKTVDQVLNE